MVPKIIHYCWFGKQPLPEDAIACITSWKKVCPDYEIREWNESNFDTDLCKYVKEAYMAKKWAFVSDYARFWILYNYGGVYFDTDVELITSIDDIVSKGAFMGCEKPNADNHYMNVVAPGLGMGFDKGNNFLKTVLDYYNNRSFIDDNGHIDTTTVVYIVSDLLKDMGYKGNGEIEIVSNIVIYSHDYFCPMDYVSGEIILSSNTRSIHHYTASWMDKTQKEIIKKTNLLRMKKGCMVAFLYKNLAEMKYELYCKGWKSVISLIVQKLKRRYKR